MPGVHRCPGEEHRLEVAPTLNYPMSELTIHSAGMISCMKYEARNLIEGLFIMPQCACASEVYGSVFVCVYCYSCSSINLVKVRVL